MEEKAKRLELRHYFENTTSDKDIIREIFLLTGSLISTTLVIVWALTTESSLANFLSILSSEVTLYTLIRYIYYWFLKPKFTEEQVDDILREDFARVSRYSGRKLNLLDSERVTLTRLDQITIYGIIVDEKTKQPRNVPKKEKKDKTYHFAANRVIVFEMTPILIGVYVCDLNSLEMPKTSIIDEKTFECFYKDVDSFEVTSHSPFADLKLHAFTNNRLSEIFDILDSDVEISNDEESDNIFSRMLEQISATDQETQSLQRLRNLKKMYGNKNFVIQEFLIRTVSGETIGTTIGKLQAVDDEGLANQDEADRKIQLLQRMLREIKELGAHSDAPIHTT